MNQTYHIDVTPEEDSLFRNVETISIKKPKPYKTYIAIVAAHLLIIGLVFGTTLSLNAKEQTKETTAQQDQKFIADPDPNKIVPTTTLPAPALKPQTTNNSTLTKIYTVKQGDTLHSISKKYKLNLKKLIQINNIKDPSKITVGQKLNFF